MTWFKWMHPNGQLLSWSTFLHSLESIFVLSLYEDPKEALLKVCQTTSVKKYQAQFEALANRNMGLPPLFYLCCFISGLKPAICREVQGFQPLFLAQAIHLAKLKEDTFFDRTPFSPKSFQLTTTINSSSSFELTMPVTPPKTQTPIKRLSLYGLQTRQKKDLCYNCYK